MSGIANDTPKILPAGYRPAQKELAGKTILITGAGAGIGRAAALAYAACGAEVLMLGRTERDLETLYDEIVAAGGVKPGIVPLDLGKANHDTFSALAGELGDSFEKIDGLLHNASVLGDRKPIAQTNASAWHEVMQINVNGMFMLTQALLPLLNAATNASIVMTSSSVGRKGRAFWGAYSVSKFATEGFMQVLADELENTTAIRVNSLNPGAMNTGMRRMAYPGEAPMSNPTPETLMDLWVYLMSDASKGVSGRAFNAQQTPNVMPD